MASALLAVRAKRVVDTWVQSRLALVVVMGTDGGQLRPREGASLLALEGRGANAQSRDLSTGSQQGSRGGGGVAGAWAGALS